MRTVVVEADVEDAGHIEALWNAAHAHLVRKKASIAAEILDYPFPIPACDAQYNYLLEQRDLVNQQLRQLHVLLENTEEPASTLAQLKAMAAASPLFDRETRRILLAE